jgi:hypothetical protein
VVDRIREREIALSFQRPLNDQSAKGAARMLAVRFLNCLDILDAAFAHYYVKPGSNPRARWPRPASPPFYGQSVRETEFSESDAPRRSMHGSLAVSWPL